MRIQVQIGGFRAQYVLCKTNAPVNYDGMGTFEVYSSGGHAPNSELVRMVLVREEHLEWQKGRNASGMKTLEVHPSGDQSVGNWVEEKLVKCLTGLD